MDLLHLVWFEICLLSAFAWTCIPAIKTFYMDELCTSGNNVIKVGSTLSGANSSGILKFSGYGVYPPNFWCALSLVPAYEHGITVSLKKMDVRFGCLDKLTLHDALGSRNDYCSNFVDSMESMFYQSLGKMTIEFSSSLGAAYRAGFELTFTSYKADTCASSKEFECDNYFCISKELKCDGHNHCGDRSDQDTCGMSVRTIIGIMAGVLIIVLIFLAAVSNSQKRRTREAINAASSPLQNVYTANCPLPSPVYYASPPAYSSTPTEKGKVNPGYT